MYRIVLTAGRNLPKAIVASSQQPTLCSLSNGRRCRSTKVNHLKKVIPEFWIMKVKTAFAYHDVDGDGYITEKDFAYWAERMEKLLPNINDEQRKILETTQDRVWGDYLDGKGKGPDYKVTESMYIEKFFNIVNKEGAEGQMRKEWRDVFEVMDVNRNGVISKKEHRRFFEARKNVDPNGAIVAFSAIDRDMDGSITCDEYVNAGVEFFFDFVDETKPSKYFFGPLVKI